MRQSRSRQTTTKQTRKETSETGSAVPGSKERARGRIGDKIKELEALYAQSKIAYKQARTDFEEAKEQFDVSLQAQSILQDLAKQTQQQAHQRIAQIVTKCLQSVFDKPYEFKIHFEQKRGRTEAHMVFVKDGHEVDTLSASGGGLVDVASFALRLACLILSRPSPRRFIALDEPFKFVSEYYRPMIRQLLEELASQTKFTFLITTHIPELEVGNVIRIN